MIVITLYVHVPVLPHQTDLLQTHFESIAGQYRLQESIEQK